MKKVFLCLFLVLISLCGNMTQASERIIKKEVVLQEEYRVTGYRKIYNGWEKAPLKIRVTAPQYGGKEKIEVIAYQTSYGWQTVSYAYVSSVSELLDGKEIAANYEYKVSCGGTVYFNF